MKFKTIIFDLDGTIADTLPLCIAAFKKSVEPLLNATISDDEIIATFGPSEEGTIRKLIPQHETAGVAAYLKNYEELHYTCPVPFEGVKELLQELKNAGVKLGMVTGKGLHSTIISLKQFELSEYFEIMETGSPEGPNKVAGIVSILNRLGSDISESLYVGDAPSDIKYCKEVGIPIAAAAWASTRNGSELEPLNPDWIFYSIADFKDWLIS
ncbi:MULTISPECIES: HAD hydrolase-like protein [unclassified Mucilaginibacter]|uniref:HAD family hydrolase n=1 Tax=unclassified Mucilaginibacter TaxID=2617802 RepID=UPI002AC8D9ED|nr:MULTISPECIES: HAD hydrolase-like protein [unclassified Mucilaginibacter]MEB0262259.1 HAD hydrolase-like protein [Mucilaginibacter sp. 10I4]MEB0277117.1 HAD hydrolase-like protein [Mucilaginibacter sp. 10B2]MEB0301817.1 HAD hydrolase-like protein [Mucilaginibacter sp. 5C4]WPX25217.1 HAD hydrolase-like protein [Mucilaginibacter sp. 5C4]